MFRSTDSTDYQQTLTSIERSQATNQFKPDGTIIKANEDFLNAMGYMLFAFCYMPPMGNGAGRVRADFPLSFLQRI